MISGGLPVRSGKWRGDRMETVADSGSRLSKNFSRCFNRPAAVVLLEPAGREAAATKLVL
jgi:hypothetical protein